MSSRKDWMNTGSSSSNRIYRKKLPRGWFTHLFSPSYYYPYHFGDWTYSCGFLIFWIFYIPSLLRCRLKTSPQGLELSTWPGKQISATWDEVIRLEHKKLLGAIVYDRLYLDRSFYEGYPVIIVNKKGQEWVDKQKMFIPLSDFQGWPDGDLADDLRRYVPQVFSLDQNE